MFEINVTVSCPDLVKAATLLVSALGGVKIDGSGGSNPGVGPVATDAAGTVPVSAVSVSAAPLAQAPTYTLEQVSKAGADLLTAQPAKMQELMGLMAQFGVQTVNALRTDQLGAFATALRGMGAQI